MPDPNVFFDLKTGEPLTEANATPQQRRAMKLFALVNEWNAGGVGFDDALGHLADCAGAVVATMGFTGAVDEWFINQFAEHMRKAIKQNKMARQLETSTPPGKAN